MTDLYVQDDLELTHLGEDTSLVDATAGVVARTEDARQKQEALASAQGITAVIQAGRADLHARLARKRTDLMHYGASEAEAALLDFASADHTASAHRYATYAHEIEWLEQCIRACDSVTMPAQQLSQWCREASSLRALANLRAAQAIEASVQRHEASRTLLSTDGAVNFGNNGRAHSLLVESLELHRRAAQIDTAIHAETRRLSLIQAAEGKKI